MIITKGENFEIQNEVRVPHVFQVFFELCSSVILNMNILPYNRHSNINNDVICNILEIYLS